MLDSIIKFSIKNKIVVGLFTLLLIIWGLWSASKLPVDAVPDITNNQVQIITVCPSLAGQEVEQLVTFPIEKSIANLPDLEETRSISRFGLSVITVVFKDEVDIYFARQLINEKLKEAQENIPEGIGTPELAPVSTGLGEIYQYLLKPKPGSEDKYTPKDLRSMQDWIVSRQLYGIEGVAEVNSFGGEVKQYEVAINPSRLLAMGVSISEIFDALEKNNQNTGGAYIDKKPNAYFIRGIGLAQSIDDIKMISVKNENGHIPIFIKDVADIRLGAAIRYGAMTYNGESNVVGGVVMMLKGANSNEVVKRVKDKIPAIQKSLPDDIELEPFLDRTDLVGRAINTVKNNLIEGALIVIFVLVIFLGNLRAGLIVASAIPLSLLFALGLMNVFGVSANLMSLGAIDFGLIVDGAVIVVEATLHHLASKKFQRRLTQAEMDEEVFKPASKMMNSAAFGQIIILIVYIPILTLVGVEGKMFTPMAKTVSFAILGALILSVTYIPVMSSLFLSKQPKHKVTFADKFINKLLKVYQPLLKKAIQFKYAIVSAAIVLFVISFMFFKRMGGEFIPQLQEGDFVFHCILPQGSSLNQSIETSMHAARILKEFDEVKSVIVKTGAAEVPTDPMPPEVSDMVILLKDPKDWPKKKPYPALAEEMVERLKLIPGIFFETNQPIQMRFNELMTGIRQDVAVKIFGEDLDTLFAYANKVSDLVAKVPGVTTPQVEQIVGLPQINVEYNRTKLANYGISVKEVNDILSTAFAGKTAGQIFENERRYDLVVRLDSSFRTDIHDVSNLMIPTANGMQIPMSQVANVEYKLGPSQISREDSKRRVVIGFNVAGRDIQSVVKEIQEKLNTEVKLPVGYYYTYGGQFENLQQATNRLLVAVPISLLLIFLLLYFAFNSVKQAALIFTAIPMSAIGGIFALMARDMPFSISAGIGFIALFGVAVLNGIVLLGTFNELKKEGETDILTIIMKGTSMRLRPVLMTATVASLGFLPMAISSGAGAEVQKPLATVVIGGLVSATFLTLFVLPLLYLLFNTSIRRKKRSKMKPIVASILFVFIANSGISQERITLQQAIDSALKNNGQFAINEAELRAINFGVQSAKAIDKTGIFVENEDMRPSDSKGILKVGLSQSIAWPGLYAARKKYFQEQAEGIQLNKKAIESTLKKEVKETYYLLWYWQDKEKLYQRLDSLYSQLNNATTLRLKTGDVAGIDQLASESRLKEIKAELHQIAQEKIIYQQQLMLLTNVNAWMLPLDHPLSKKEWTVEGMDETHPILSVQAQQIEIANAEIDVQKNTNKPEFSGRVFSQRLWGAKDPFTGFSVSTAIPLFSANASRKKVKQAEAHKEMLEQKLTFQQSQFNNQLETAKANVEKHLALLRFYEDNGLQQAQSIIKAASLSYRTGEIGFADLSQYLSQAISLEQNYLNVLNQYNQAVIQLEFFQNR